jgi:hypothetical protein
MSYVNIVICIGSLPILETWPPIYRGQERAVRDRLKASQVYTHIYFRYTPCLTNFTFEFIRRPISPILSPSSRTFVELTLITYSSTGSFPKSPRHDILHSNTPSFACYRVLFEWMRPLDSEVSSTLCTSIKDDARYPILKQTSYGLSPFLLEVMWSDGMVGSHSTSHIIISKIHFIAISHCYFSFRN